MTMSLNDRKAGNPLSVRLGFQPLISGRLEDPGKWWSIAHRTLAFTILPRNQLARVLATGRRGGKAIIRSNKKSLVEGSVD